MTRRFGPALYADFFAPYTRKLWGLDPARLSSEWAPQRIGSFDLGLALRKLVGLAREEPRTYARRFLYPRLGMGQLFSAIAAEVERLGGRIERKCAVTGLRREGAALRAVCTERGELEARAFVSTLPLPRLLGFLGTETPLRFRGLRFLNVLLDAPANLGSTWAYLSDGGGLATRVQEPARRSPFMVPPGRGSLQLEIPAVPGDAVDALGDAELFERVARELRRAGLPLPDAVRGLFSTRQPCAYPIFELGAQAWVRDGLARAGELSNLTSCGRQGAFTYVFADRAMEQGIACARRLLGLPPGWAERAEEDRCVTEASSLHG
jgi:protoporphyrinogen oxidase